MKESFVYLFKDNKWIIKFLTVFVFVFVLIYGGHFCIKNSNSTGFALQLCNWVPMALACFVSFIIVSGYKIICVKAFMNTAKNKIAPFLRLKMDFKTGFKYICAYALFHSCCLFGIGILGLITGLSVATRNKTLLSIMLIVLLLGMLGYILYWLIAEFAYIYMYVENPSFLNFFKLKELFSKIGGNKKQYFTAVALNFVLNVVTYILCVLLIRLFLHRVNSIDMLFISTFIIALTDTYKLFVSCMLIDKSLNKE